ncbi:flavin-containing monooxygenase 5-like [Diadema setosum]|uniref:flavin-containing monooxygenase 5-like n=1 Tax=Diadema setosum TaxID=31175 RepID=UPI003B3B4472
MAARSRIMSSDNMQKILSRTELEEEIERKRIERSGKLTKRKTMPLDRVPRTDVCVIGAGISGLAAAKCLRESGLDVVVYERTGEVGGLWVFREHDYGVMRFTHINVSKQNYCFSDFPFPDNVPEFPHNRQMAQYIADYTTNFKLQECIKFHRKVTRVEKEGDSWRITSVAVEDDGKGREKFGQEEVLIASHVAIATGHHAKPSWAKFPGQDKFKGEVIHSVDYKDAITNRMVGKRVLLVGIGNSAVDAAVDLATVGRCQEVHISSRSGAWVFPNYLFGRPIDHYSSRLLLWLPLKIMNPISEFLLSVIHGHPNQYGLFPKMRVFQTQPTVSPVLFHHIQRKNVLIHPNIDRMEEKRVFFTDGSSVEVDHIVLCTGYHIDLPFLSDDIRKEIMEVGTNTIKLYKNVFAPSIGKSLAFIGFVQPASGGVLSMSEVQARWFAELCKDKVQLPPVAEMKDDIDKELRESAARFFKSERHTIQKDPILYNDDISQKFGAKPQLWRHPTLAWRLLLGTCGPAQYRLQGPNTWPEAAAEVRKVPITGFAHYGTLAVVLPVLLLLLWCFLVLV